MSDGVEAASEIAGLISHFRSRDRFSRVTVITPTFYSAFYMRRAVSELLCENDGPGRSVGMFNVEFLGVSEVADRLAEAHAGNELPPRLSNLVASQLVRGALADLRTPGPLARYADNERLRFRILRTFRQLDSFDQTSEFELGAHIDGYGGLRSQVLEGYQQYQRATSQYLSSTRIAKLAMRAMEQGVDEAERALGTIQLLVALQVDLGEHRFLWGRLSSLTTATTISSGAETKRDVGSATSFYTSLSYADEPRAVVRNILKDARQGSKFGEMAVFYPSQAYASRIREALLAANIRVTGPDPISLAETASGRFVVNLLNLASDDVRQKALAQFLVDSPVVDRRTGRRVPGAKWDEISRKARIAVFGPGGSWERRIRGFSDHYRRLARSARQDPDIDESHDPEALEAVAELADELSGFVEDLLVLLDHSSKGSWSERVEWLEEAMNGYLVMGKRNSASPKGWEEVRKALSVLMELGEVSDGEVTLEQFIEGAMFVLRQPSSSVSGLGSGVLVAPLHDSLGCVFKHIHVLGMSEGNYPSPISSDPLLSDEDRARLDPSGETLPSGLQRLALRRREFELALETSRSRRFYWNQWEVGNNNTSHPSQWYLEELRKELGDPQVQIQDLLDDPSRYVEVVDPISKTDANDGAVGEAYEIDLRLAAASRLGSVLDHDVVNRNAVDALRMLKSRASDAFTEYDGNVDGLPGFFDDRVVSATSFQRYGECPFKFFLAEVLGVEESIELEDELTLTPLSIGNIVHEILERFASNRDSSSDLDEQRRVLSEVAEKVFSEFKRDQIFANSKIYELETRRIDRDLVRWLEAEAGILGEIPDETFAEWRFGFEGLKVVKLDTAIGNSIRFRGVVDRIDVSRNGKHAKVIDYKTGSSSYFTDVESDGTARGTKLQLALYSLAARQMMPSVEDVEAFFWFVFGTGATTIRPMAKLEGDKAIKALERVADVVSKGVQHGNFPARPGSRQSQVRSWHNCRQCSYTDSCTVDRLEGWQRIRGDAGIEDYSAMAEPEKS